MITSSTGLGFNPFHALRRVASNPLVQNVAVAAGNQYAPGAVADVNKARAIYQSAQGPRPGPHGKPGHEPMPDGGGDMGPPPSAGSNHMMIYGLVGAGVLVALLMMNK